MLGESTAFLDNAGLENPDVLGEGAALAQGGRGFVVGHLESWSVCGGKLLTLNVSSEVC